MNEARQHDGQQLTRQYRCGRRRGDEQLDHARLLLLGNASDYRGGAGHDRHHKQSGKENQGQQFHQPQRNVGARLLNRALLIVHVKLFEIARIECSVHRRWELAAVGQGILQE